MCQETRVSDQKKSRYWAEILNKLSDERNLRDLHLKHYLLSTAQFKKRTTYLDIPGKIYD